MTQNKTSGNNTKSIADHIKGIIARKEEEQREIRIRTEVERNLRAESALNYTPKTANFDEATAQERPPRRINSEKLSEYFKPQFKGMGNGTINHFETFIRDLEPERTKKDFAYIAKMCVDGKQMNDRKPKNGKRPNFNKWYSLFCEFTGCEKGTYKPNDLTEIPDNLKRIFSYLQ